jgi:aminocarboxymuconate-semialdehyde decarboxylase
MSIIDFHNHYYPPEYLEALQKRPGNMALTFDDDGNPVLHYPGDYNVVVPGHRDIELRDGVLEREGVDRQVLSFTAPGILIESTERAVELAPVINDALARIVDERGHRFSALATLPLNDPRESVAELDRAMTRLGLPGAMLFSNVNGTALADERFWPLYERASDLEAVLYIHPTQAIGVEAMLDYWLMPLIGFTYDTTLAAAKLVFSGAVERFPGIRWALGHLGGAIPYLAERLDRGFEAFEECRRDIDRPPSWYLKRFYYDTVNFDPKALQLAIDFAGADQLLAGSDYPHRIGSISKMQESIGALDIGEAERAGILGGNAAALLGLDGAGG